MRSQGWWSFESCDLGQLFREGDCRARSILCVCSQVDYHFLNVRTKYLAHVNLNTVAQEMNKLGSTPVTNLPIELCASGQLKFYHQFSEDYNPVILR